MKSAPDQSPIWSALRQNRTFAALGGAVVVALLAWFVVLTGQRKEAYAARALDQARNAAETGNLPLAASELQKVITTYAGTRAAQEAVITMNQVRLVNGQYELAAVNLQDFLKTTPPAQFRAPAEGLLGRALENAGRPAEAAAAYERAAKASELDYLKGGYLLDAARSYTTAGDSAKAIDAYRRILKDLAKSGSQTEAEIRLGELTGGAP